MFPPGVSGNYLKIRLFCLWITPLFAVCAFKGATDCTDLWSVLSLNSVVSEQYAFGAALSLGQRTFLAFGELMTSTLDMDRGFASPAAYTRLAFAIALYL